MKPSQRPIVSLVAETGMFFFNVYSFHKLWSTLKSSVFGLSSSLPPLVSEGGGLRRESVGKANLLSDYFDCN